MSFTLSRNRELFLMYCIEFISNFNIIIANIARCGNFFMSKYDGLAHQPICVFFLCLYFI